MRRRVLASTLPMVLAAQTAVLQIRVVEGEAAIQATGSRVSAPLSVVVTDEVGKPVGGAAVSFRLPEEGPSGTFANGLKTAVAVADARGRATASAIRWNRLPGPVQIRVTAVKDQARAGMVVSQYLSDSAPARGGGARAASGSKSRWLAFTVVVAGAAAAGFAWAGTRGFKGQMAATQPPVRIGPPAINVGQP